MKACARQPRKQPEATAVPLPCSSSAKEEPGLPVGQTKLVLKSNDGTSLTAEFQRRATDFQQRHSNACLGFVYEETMEQLLKEGRVYSATSSKGQSERTMVFTRKAMTDAMEHAFFAGRSWNAVNQLELRLAERIGTSDGNAVTPIILINTATGDRRDILSITWNGVHLTNESEILFP